MRLTLLHSADGFLDLKGTKERRQILLSDGVPISARSNVVRENLLWFLLDGGHISKSTYDRLLQRDPRAAWKRGSSLARYGLLSPEKLNALETELCQKIVSICFGWTRAAFRFKPISSEKLPRCLTPLNPIDLYTQWMREDVSPQRIIRESKRHSDRRIRWTRIADSHQELVDESLKSTPTFSEAVGSHQTVGELLDTVERPLDVSRMFNALLHLGFIRLFKAAEDEWVALDSSAMNAGMSEDALHPLPPDEDGSSDEGDDIEAPPPSSWSQSTSDSRPKGPVLDAEEAEDGEEDDGDSTASDPDELELESEVTSDDRNLSTLSQMATAESDEKDRLAHLLFWDGLTYLKLSDYEEAAHHFRQALEHTPKNAKYLSYLGWSVYMNASGAEDGQRRGKQHLERAMEIEPELDTPYALLGNLCYREGAVRTSVELYQKALDINPDNKEAKRGLKRFGQQ